MTAAHKKIIVVGDNDLSPETIAAILEQMMASAGITLPEDEPPATSEENDGLTVESEEGDTLTEIASLNLGGIRTEVNIVSLNDPDVEPFIELNVKDEILHLSASEASMLVGALVHSMNLIQG